MIGVARRAWPLSAVYLRHESSFPDFRDVFCFVARATLIAEAEGHHPDVGSPDAAALLNIGLNFWLVPAYGMIGAAVSTLVAYVALFAGMVLNANRVYPVAYQWRRVATLIGVAVALTVLGSVVDVPLAVAILIALSYPLVLLPLRFYLPAERRRLRGLFGSA